jgi:hypothetical protein
MTSVKQIEANRRNSLKSTGPISSAGKERSRANAWRHGLTAETVIVSLDDAEDYEAFQEAVVADYDATTAVERELVLRLASVLWRLRRASAIEAAMFELMAHASSSEPHRSNLSATDAGCSSSGGRHLVRCFLRLMELPSSALDRLTRYEYTLWRQARQIIITLQSLSCRPARPRHFHFYRKPPNDQTNDE